MYRCSVDFGSAGSPKPPPKRSLEAIRAEAASILLEKTVSPPPSCLAIKSPNVGGAEAVACGLRLTYLGSKHYFSSAALVDLMRHHDTKSCSRRVFLILYGLRPNYPKLFGRWSQHGPSQERWILLQVEKVLHRTASQSDPQRWRRVKQLHKAAIQGSMLGSWALRSQTVLREASYAFWYDEGTAHRSEVSRSCDFVSVSLCSLHLEAYTSSLGQTLSASSLVRIATSLNSTALRLWSAHG